MSSHAASPLSPPPTTDTSKDAAPVDPSGPKPALGLSSRIYHSLVVADPSIPREKRTTPRKRDFGIVPIPKNRRHDPSLKPEEQFLFSWRMNIVFALAATTSVMNLYYIQPMLVHIASDFGTTYEAVSRIPTLVQAGYGCGIVLITPLGDLVRRRELVLLLFTLTCAFTVALAMARSVTMLEGFSFVVGMFSVPPQICIPWTADLAPSDRRARAMSITLSGLIFGLVIGRVFGGILSNFAAWRDTYWMAVGLQGTMVVVLWFSLPDTPDKDIGLSYLQLYTMFRFFTQYPTLVQVAICQCLTSAVFGGFWTSLTFLLSDPPYHYNSLDIGLFGLLGIIGALLAPQWGRLVDKIVPWTGQLMGTFTGLVAMVIAFAAADISIAAIAFAIILYDCGQQLSQISSSYRLAGIDPKARARLNGCSLLAIFIGQTSGTAVLSKIYTTYGWRPTGGTAVAFVGMAIFIVLLRGPHETGWIGWHGGYELIKRAKLQDLSPHAITEGIKTSRAETAVPSEAKSVGEAEQGHPPVSGKDVEVQLDLQSNSRGTA